jgi:hypothetical protein
VNGKGMTKEIKNYGSNTRQNSTPENKQSKDLIKSQFPDFVSELDWEEGDEEFLREKAPLLGIDNAEEMDEDELFEAGYEAVSELSDKITVYTAADKIINNS